jgi:DnaK suppressor protein
MKRANKPVIKKSAPKNTAAKPAAAKKPVVLTAGLKEVRRKLLELRATFTAAARNRRAPEDLSPDNGDPIDQASQSIEKELNFELSDNERTSLDQIEAALRKIDLGTYGICESCRKPISKPRLRALPFARYGIDCQTAAESAQNSSGEIAQDFRALGEEPAVEI